MIPQDIGVSGTFVISDQETLTRIRRHTGRFMGRGAYRHIEVALPVAQREHFGRRINKHYRACGCLEGGILVLLTIATLLAWNLIRSNPPEYGWGDLPLDFGVVLSAGVIGKVFGIVRAHLALGGTLRELASASATLDDNRGPR